MCTSDIVRYVIFISIEYVHRILGEKLNRRLFDFRIKEFADRCEIIPG